MSESTVNPLTLGTLGITSRVPASPNVAAPETVEPPLFSPGGYQCSEYRSVYDNQGYQSIYGETGYRSVYQ